MHVCHLSPAAWRALSTNHFDSWRSSFFLVTKSLIFSQLLPAMSFIRSAGLVLLTAIIVMYVPTMMKRRLAAKAQGYAAPGWRKVADVFRCVIPNSSRAVQVYYREILTILLVLVSFSLYSSARVN